MDINFESIKIALEKVGFLLEEIKPINEGKNSFSYLVKTQTRNFFLKIYRKNHFNARDRLSSEINFLNYLREIKLNNVPKPIIYDVAENWILLSWVEGKKIIKPEEDDCNSLLEFISDIQNYKFSEYAKKIGNASEANFTIYDHICHIKSRVESLKNYLFKNKKNLNQRSAIFSLLNKFSDELNSYEKEFDFSKKSIQTRIISPSDIGFHNVLKNKDKVNFIDFEYAGWDDPRKLLSDLVLQPQYNIPINCYQTFVGLFKKKEFSFEFLQDSSIVFELYRIKWVLIMLNPVLYSKSDDFLNVEIMQILKRCNLYLEESKIRLKKFKNLYLNLYFT